MGLNRESKEEETGFVVDILFPFNAYSGSTKPEDTTIGINYLANYISGEVVVGENEPVEYRRATIVETRELKESKFNNTPLSYSY